jgi:predicted nucleotidyltransferase
MNSINEAKQRLTELESKSTFEKMVQVAAILTKLLEKKHIRPVIVGGLAVEIYTRSDYTTVDIDMIVSDRELAGEILKELGFTIEGRHWYHERLLVSIEIPNDMLEDADDSKVTEIQITDELKIFVIGIEDIILDRLRACIHWKSTSDCEWGKRMYLLHHERLDIEYIKEMSKKDLTMKLLEQWLQESKYI